MKKYIILLSIFLFWGSAVSAAELRFESDAIPPSTGEWRVKLILNTESEKINTLGATLNYSGDAFVLKGVETAGSIVNFWLDNPVLKDNSVVFSGITPGGFQGEKGEVLTLVLEAKKPGSGKLSISNGEAYLNDGLGTKTNLLVKDFVFETTAGVVGGASFKDENPPQKFDISLGKSEVLFGNKWFVAFGTSDKESGVVKYEIQEIKGGPKEGGWVSAQSPFELKDQNLRGSIYVRATDAFGNTTVSVLHPIAAPYFYRKPLFWGILTMLSASILFIWIFIGRKKVRI